MDYRLNNEGIVACVAAQVVRHGCQKLSVVVAVTNLLMHDTERKKVKGLTDTQRISMIVNQIDGGLLTIIMNSLVMLMKGGCMTFENGVLALTEAGLNMCEQMKDGRSNMLVSIMNDMPDVLVKIGAVEEEIMDKRYMIAL
ncbi:MAG: hypothetical protein J6O49_19935 [Bacteroidaceae bacterium]|nr:hypothetical protein [Bacteroidaceae bacterium]